METKDLFYPDIRVEIGPYTFTEGVSLDVSSSADSYFDWAKVRFTKEFETKLSLAKRDEAIIYLGYEGSMEEVFRGFVTKPYSGSAKDEMTLLEIRERIRSKLSQRPEIVPDSIETAVSFKEDMTVIEIVFSVYENGRQSLSLGLNRVNVEVVKL